MRSMIFDVGFETLQHFDVSLPFLVFSAQIPATANHSGGLLTRPDRCRLGIRAFCMPAAELFQCCVVNADDLSTDRMSEVP